MPPLPSWLNPFKKKDEAPGSAPSAAPLTPAAPSQKPEVKKAALLAESPDEQEALKGLEGAPKGLKAFFYRKWKDPAFLKEIRTLAGYMAKDGVNIKDMKQVKAWLEKNEEAIKEGRFKEPLSTVEKTETFVKTGPDVGRNDPCPCGSGKKYKKCCGVKAAAAGA
jgi:hypothetical protein